MELIRLKSSNPQSPVCGEVLYLNQMPEIPTPAGTSDEMPAFATPEECPLKQVLGAAEIIVAHQIVCPVVFSYAPVCEFPGGFFVVFVHIFDSLFLYKFIRYADRSRSVLI